MKFYFINNEIIPTFNGASNSDIFRKMSVEADAIQYIGDHNSYHIKLNRN